MGKFNKPDIKSLKRDELNEMLDSWDQAQFRKKQLFEWLYQKGVRSFDEMTNLPLQLRDKLSESFSLTYPKIIDKQISQDKTRKYLLELSDGISIESVGMPSGDKLSVCISSQAGCRVNCAFCATGKNGFTRNLTVGEIVDQVRVVGEDFGMRPSSVVVMGQGEGFLNYDNLLEALRIINDPNGLNIGARHITVSTVGMIVGIDRLALEPEQFTLAISLHSAVQRTRDILLPGVQNFTLERLKKSILHYVECTSRRPSYEYALIKDFNDDEEHLNALINYTRGTMCHVNLIQLNKVEGSEFEPVSTKKALEFKEALQEVGVECTIRKSRGNDIDAACGQLKQRHSSKTANL